MTITSIFRTLLRPVVRDASAHCDTEDGPAVTDGRRALDSGNVNIALKWVHPGGEDEIRAAFDKVRRVRVAGGEAREVADRWFLETLVRVHRAGEGAGFHGIEPAGTGVAPQVVAADQALELGSIEPLRGLVEDDRWGELERRFDRAVALRGFDPDDLVAARGYMEAYVQFFKYAEGHEHDDHGHGHAQHQHAH